MMNFDVIIIGSGPAGVSAAFPLVAAGQKVLMVDGGNDPAGPLPSQPFLTARAHDQEQWKWMIGQSFHTIRTRDTVSPKLRVPAHEKVFSDFNAVNRIHSNNFIAVGSLASGGLSNAWGCGVARYSSDELAEFPFNASELDISYESVTRRMGVSGAQDDDLSEYFGLDQWSQPPIQIDALHKHMYGKYEKNRKYLKEQGFRMGKSRSAALSADFNGRQHCDRSGNCLYGCNRGALYSATMDLTALKRFSNFHYEAMIVDTIRPDEGKWLVEGSFLNLVKTFSASKILLAAGTLATTRLALNALKLRRSVRLLNCPTAAFILCLPSSLGNMRSAAFGLGQLSFVLSLRDNVAAFGSTFVTSGLPMSEFLRYLPLRRRYGVDFLKALLSACVVGNVFLPGHFSSSQVHVDHEGSLHIQGGYSNDADTLLSMTASRLRRLYRRLGAYMLPMSFTIGKPGGDIHYAGTLPMRVSPSLGETSSSGELQGLSGVYVIDGACLPMLSEKSHTLTIMANADRIGRSLVNAI
jgi:choline dehydrogenase-like flavoprotein